MIESILEEKGKEYTLERRIKTTDATGEVTYTLDTIQTAQGILDDLNGKDREAFDKMGVLASKILYCLEENLSEGDFVEFENKRYKVVYVQNPMTFSEFFQVYLEYDENVYS